jgi:leucyl aminopeptidase
MKVSHSNKQIKSHTIVPCYEEQINTDYLSQITGFKKISDFKGESGELYSLIHPETAKKIILIGLGKKSKSDHCGQAIRKAVFFNLKLDGALTIYADHLDTKTLEQVAYGAALAFYNINIYKESKEEKKLGEVKIFASLKDAADVIKKGTIMAQSTSNAMDLINLPSNIILHSRLCCKIR